MSQESLWSNFTAQYHGSQLQDVRTSLREPANYQARLCSICTFLLIFGFPVLLPYLFSIFFVSDEDGKDQSLECIPPSYPNCLPLFGHALAFASDMPGTITRFAKHSKGIPYRLHLYVMKIFLISQVEDIISLLSQSQHTTNKTYREIAVGTVFGMPPQARNFIASDDSGLSHKPFPENKVKPEQRIDYLTHVSMGRFIHGPGLRPLATRFTQNILRSFSDLGIDDEWTELPDLYRFIQKCIFEASVPAMFGRQLIQRNSSFCEDFWDFDAGVPDLAKGLPKWAIPGAYKARDKCLETIKKHHLFLSQHQKDMIPDGNACGYNDLYGAEIIRYRHDMWSKMNAIDANARAAEDLGMIWGANSNSSHAAFWLTYHTLRDTQALRRFREALSLAKTVDAASDQINLDKLCASPYVSALYAETLRLRSSSIIMRKANRRDLRFGRWLIPKGSIVGFTGWTTHFDERLWNTGTLRDPHPLTEFWTDRFLVYPDSHRTGPTNPSMQKAASITTRFEDPFAPPRSPDMNDTQAPSELSTTTKNQKLPSPLVDHPPSPPPKSPTPPHSDSVSPQPIFTTEGLHGIFLPYGGGQNMCPGRHFAKQEILLTVAALTSSFDIELLGAETKESYRFFGTGVLGPQGKTRFRLRKRAIDIKRISCDDF